MLFKVGQSQLCDMNNLYIYHQVPKSMIGTVLYPLNELKIILPEIYEKEAGKYLGREQVMNQRVPILDCFWNDVLHFSPVHPAILKQTLIDAGGDADLTISAYQINVKLLDPDKTVIYLHSKKIQTLEEFIPFNTNILLTMADVPEFTKEYYRRSFEAGEKPLRFLRIPHILYKGSLDISKAIILNV